MAFNNAQKESKDFSNKRFMIRLSITDKNSNAVDTITGEPVKEFIICQRYFDTFHFIEGSMNSVEFKRTVDACVFSIQEELAMESRIWQTYNWTGCRPLSFGRTFEDGVIGGKPMPEELKKNGGFYDDDDILDDDLKTPMAEPWTYTLKFSVLDNERRGDNKVVIEKIFDGTPYPKEIRENIDLTNDFKGTDTDRLNGNAYIKAIIKRNRENLVSTILNKIYSVCSPNTKENTPVGSDNKRILKMLDETIQGYNTGAKAIYFLDKERKNAWRDAEKSKATAKKDTEA